MTLTQKFSVPIFPAAYFCSSVFHETLRNSGLQMFFQIGVLKNFANFIGKQLCCSLFLIKLQASSQVFSCKICEIFKNTYLEEHLQATVSESLMKHRGAEISCRKNGYWKFLSEGHHIFGCTILFFTHQFLRTPFFTEHLQWLFPDSDNITGSNDKNTSKGLSVRLR